MFLCFINVSLLYQFFSDKDHNLKLKKKKMVKSSLTKRFVTEFVVVVVVLVDFNSCRFQSIHSIVSSLFHR